MSQNAISVSKTVTCQFFPAILTCSQDSNVENLAENYGRMNFRIQVGFPYSPLYISTQYWQSTTHDEFHLFMENFGQIKVAGHNTAQLYGEKIPRNFEEISEIWQ